MKYLSVFFIAFLSINISVAQEVKVAIDSTLPDGVSFKPVNEFYIFGDATVIGNNLLSEDTKKPYNNKQEDNDNIKMKYVDIDDNPETFSSSQAKLTLPDDFKKIVYAGLYWTATYAYEKGVRKTVNNNFIYSGNGERSSVINQIKIKLPNQEYQDVTGDVIYDGSTNVAHAINSPYVCYADVTKLFQNTEDKAGNYTVANVKATEGYLSGGSAAGWMLYIIYQTPTDNPKYISTYNGFANVNDKPIDIVFKNFKSIDYGNVKTSMVVSALEGDNNLDLDECAILKANSNQFQSLSNGARYQQNFFNSTITNNSMVNRDRYPNSENTLGFDIAQLQIPNYNNSIISNDISETTMRLKTKSDRFYLYFTAFQTEIAQTFFEDVVQETTPVSKKAEVEPEIVRSNASTIASKDPKDTKRAPYVYYKKGLSSSAFRYLKRKKSTAVVGIEGGYYVITNTFLEQERANNWKDSLIKKGFDADVFVNSKNNWNYVYVLRSDFAEEAFKLMEELKTNYRYRDTWVFKANLD
jgi:cell division septation protein DedD